MVIYHIPVHMKMILQDNLQLMTYVWQTPMTDPDPVHFKTELFPLTNIIQPFSFNCQHKLIKLWFHSKTEKTNCIKKVKKSFPVNECNNTEESETMPIVHICSKVLRRHSNNWHCAKTTAQYSCTLQKQTFSQLQITMFKKNRWRHFQNKYPWE